MTHTHIGDAAGRPLSDITKGIVSDGTSLSRGHSLRLFRTDNAQTSIICGHRIMTLIKRGKHQSRQIIVERIC